MTEGTQLLCLIEKGVDACRYMQSYGEWTKSVWLARSILNEKEAAEVLSRWADHLASSSINKKVRERTRETGGEEEGGREGGSGRENKRERERERGCDSLILPS